MKENLCFEELVGKIIHRCGQFHGGIQNFLGMLLFLLALFSFNCTLFFAFYKVYILINTFRQEQKGNAQKYLQSYKHKIES